MEVNIHEAKTQLSRLIQRALAGEEVTIAKAGKPLVRLTPVEKRKPILGSARGMFELPEGWDAPMTDAELDEVFGPGVFTDTKTEPEKE